ncbi:MAG: ABC transporter ATP-binding protein [Acidobacteriota bacterium]|nr:ABC transporter ATP-binding protein [Acidobacteriota bacterium]
MTGPAPLPAGEPRVPAIQLDRVTKRFGEVPAVLEDVSITVAPGEFVSILGPSGCGKSTLLRLVAGLSPISSGTILIDGMTPANARETVSFIFQDPTLLPWRTVRGNVALGPELEGMARERRTERVAEMLSLVGLSHVAKRYPRELSGGMKMRVSIARALVNSPRVLLLDEPFAALDEITRDRMNEELLRLRGEHGWTVLFVTHSVAEAVFLSDRIVLLAPHPGRVAHDLEVPLAWPRTAETRTADVFDEMVAEVSRRLRRVESARTHRGGLEEEP